MNTQIMELLNVLEPDTRLENLKILLDAEEKKPAVLSQFVNNHIHTFYSFSPYSPTAVIWFARAAGLSTAGIMDHDSIAGAREFREAGRLAGVGTTCGFEARVSLKGTFLENRKANSPDQPGMAYMAFHSVRKEHFIRVQAFMASLREKRNARNREMTKRAVSVTDIPLDFDADVLPLSRFREGGTVTERHILFALAKKMAPRGNMEECYNMLGKLKTRLLPSIYISADEELMHLDEAVKFAGEIDAILCYAYLGDVSVSPTGDKAAAQYEDAYINELFRLLKDHGVNAVTFMPSRNTPEQLQRIMDLCREYEMHQISGEDINSPGQSFICPLLAQPQFSQLADAARALVNREKEQK